MSQKENSNDASSKPVEESILKSEFEELKRDMRSAQWMGWLQKNRQPLTVGVVVLLAVLAAGAFWLEHGKDQRNAAAAVYQSAINEQDMAKQQALLANVAKDYAGTVYAPMAKMRLAHVDAAHAEAHLQSLIDDPKAMQAWVWQARLDLAGLYLGKGDKAKAKAELETQVGPAYEQLRQYLLAEASDDAAQRADHLHKALDAKSYDDALKQKIQQQISAANSANQANPS